jgi:uncharacterized membrane protein YgaE (UPF0421/DUF939 family)
MFDGIIKLATLARQAKQNMVDLEALTNQLNKRIEYLNNENDELRKDNQRVRQFLSGQDE